MAYLGRKGASAALTSSDIPDGSISAVKVAADVATQAEIDLKANLASPTFTGTIGGGAIGSAVTGFTGIKETDIWRLHTNWQISSGTQAVLASNLERDDSSDFGRLGTGMSESSGVFTFPSTGIWHVSAHARARADGDIRTYLEIEIDVGSTTHAIGTTDLAANQHYATCHCEQHVDVSDTSTKTVRIQIASNNTITVLAGSSTNQTYIVFTRLGDT